MSRKDFTLIADIIKNLASEEGTYFSETARAYVARTFADRLASTNSQFKRDLFIQAATGIVPVNARKARS